MKLKRKIIFLTLFLTANIVSAQSVVMQNKGNGVHQFISTFQDADLHFYLFGDGYHNFEKNSTQEYHSHNVPTNATYFQTKPYDDEEIDELDAGDPKEGSTAPQLTKQVFKNKIEVKKSWNLMPDKETYLILMFENNDDELLSGCVELHFDNADFSIDESGILDQYNSWVSNRTLKSSEYSNEGFVKKYIWEFDELEQGEQRFIYVPTKSLGSLMDEVAVRGLIKYNDECNAEYPFPYKSNNDGNLDHINDSNYFTLREKLRKYAHDPNCIVTDPYALSIYDENQTVYYTIWFHNEGEAPAQNVNLDFFIDAPVQSMSYIASSDFCTVSFNHPLNQGADILFPSINLQGMEQVPPPNYYNTFGFVVLEICLDLPNFQHNFANSEVDIYFDNLPAVSAQNKIHRLTNTPYVQNCAYPPNLPSAKQKEKELDLVDVVISPNPTDGICNIQLFKDFFGEINVYDIEGRLLLKNKVNGSSINVDLTGFQNGVYTIVLKDNLANRIAKPVLLH